MKKPTTKLAPLTKPRAAAAPPPTPGSIEIPVLDPAPGSIRVIAGALAHKTKIEVWCGNDLGWQTLRGVVAITWRADVRGTRPNEGPCLNRLDVVLEPLMADYLTTLTPPESVALGIAGVSPEMIEAARKLILRRRRDATRKAAATAVKKSVALTAKPKAKPARRR